MSWGRELLRYGATGVGGTVANVALMGVLVELAGLAPQVAAIASTSALLVIAYGLMNHWVFADASAPDSHLKRGAQYYAVILSGKGVNYALFLGLISLGVWYPVAWVVGSVAVFAGTFTANRALWQGAPA